MSGAPHRRLRRMFRGAGGRSAPVRDAGEEGQVTDADVAGDVDLGARLGGEGDHAVDVGGLESGVGDRGGHCLAGELELAATGRLGELGRADADDRGRPREAAHSCTSTRPDTCTPI